MGERTLFWFNVGMLVLNSLLGICWPHRWLWVRMLNIIAIVAGAGGIGYMVASHWYREQLNTMLRGYLGHPLNR